MKHATVTVRVRPLMLRFYASCVFAGVLAGLSAGIGWHIAWWLL